MDLLIRVEKLEAELAAYKAAALRSRKDEVFTRIVEKLRLDESYSPMLELAVEHTTITEETSLVEACNEAEKLFRENCKRAGREFVSNEEEFKHFITQRQKEQAEQEKDAEQLKTLMK